MKIEKKKAEDVVFGAKTGRRGKYDALFADLASLQLTEVLIVDPEGEPTKTLINRLNSSLRSRKPEAPEGYSWSIRVTKDKKVGIFLTSSAGPKAVKRQKSPKATTVSPEKPEPAAVAAPVVSRREAALARARAKAHA